MTPREESFGIAAGDGSCIPVHRWLPAGRPRAIVVISHGLAEHALRYRWTGATLAGLGYAAYANDHRGHGMAATSCCPLGDIGPGGFQGLIGDLLRVVRLARTETPGAPIFLLGHSLGAYAAQRFILDNSRCLAGVALSGGSALDLRSRKAGATEPLGHGNNRAFEPARTAFDWLSRDRAIVDRYLDDPLCGFRPPPATRRSLSAAAPRLADPAELRRIRQDLPILMFTGERDPVNDFLRAFLALMQRYRLAGLRDVTTRVYPGARHEVLNETNRAEVLDDLVCWIEAVLDRRDPAGEHEPAGAGSGRIARRPLAAALQRNAQ